MEEKEFEIGDWVTIRKRIHIHELAKDYLGKTYKIVGRFYGSYILSCDSGLWSANSFILANNLSNLIKKRRKIT